MELRQYWNVIWKRRWIVLAILLVVAAVSAIMALTAKRYYETEIRFITRQEPTPDNPGAEGVYGTGSDMIFTFNRYYNWFGSEFLVDDYTQIVESDAFAASVLDTMKQNGFAQKVIDELNKQAQENVEPGKQASQLGPEMVEKLRDDIAKLKLKDVKDGLGADRTHRELHLTIVGSTGEMAKAIADASATVLTDAKLKPIQGQMVDDKPVFSQIDEARAETIQSSRSREIINAIVRVIMGLVAAIALAFLLEYLDNSVRDERDARKILDLPVLGAIPRA